MNCLSRNRSLICTALFLCALTPALAADWPQFRGPGGLATAEQGNLPTKWDAETNVAWKTALPGPGASSPIVVGERVFLTCYSGYGLDTKAPGEYADLVMHLLCLSRADGTIAWDKTLKTDAAMPRYASQVTLHGYASATPAADADTVYTLFANGEVTAWAFDGTQKWSTNLGFSVHNWGAGASPVVTGDVVLALESTGRGALVGLNKRNGEEIWRRGDISQAWDTPLILQVGGRSEAVLSTRGLILALDPATGTPLWRAKGIQDYICSSPVAADGVVYAIGARAGEAMAVRAGGQGDVSATNVLWRVGKGSNVSSPVYWDGHLYWADEGNGKVYCVDVKAGELAYEADLTPKPARIYSSPIVGGGNLYYLDRNGVTYVVAARPQFEIVSVNTLAGDGSTFNASPVASQGQLLVRSDKFLYCIGSE
jgi:outer membrane protein assembly factor BamB